VKRAGWARGAALLTVTLMLAPSSRASWWGEIETGVLHDTNLSRSEDDRAEDGILRLDGAVGQAIPIGRDGAFIWKGSIAADLPADLEALRRFAPALSLSYRRKVRLGQDAPFVGAAIFARRDDYESELRDGWGMGVSVRAGRRWPAVLLEGEIGWERRTADADPFDQEAWSGALRADWPLPWFALHGGYEFRWGDVTSTAFPDPEILAAATARAPDPAFGPGRVAYRLDASAHALEVGLRRDLPHAMAVDLSYRFERTFADDQITYDDQRLSGSYRIRF
jgi:hypothetical protein